MHETPKKSDDQNKTSPKTDDDQAEKGTGKFHYNPGNMSGRKAGIVEDIEQDPDELAEHGQPDDREKGKKPAK